MTMNLDFWRKLSPKQFTERLLSFSEDHCRFLPENGYICLMNAIKVLHERMVFDDSVDSGDEFSSYSSRDRLIDAIIYFKGEKSKLMRQKAYYDDFKIYKKLTKKIREECIRYIAKSLYGVVLPYLTPKCLYRECGHEVSSSEYISYLSSRNLNMVRYNRIYNDVVCYLDARLLEFEKLYSDM